MDVRTMAIMVGTVNVLLAVVLYGQYRFTRSYPGVGWWSAGQISVAAAMLVSALRGDSVLGHVAVPVYQALIVLGTMLIYVGALRFLGRIERRGWLVCAWVAFVAWSAVFTFVVDSATLRAVGLYVTIGVLLAMTGVALWRFRPRSVRRSALFLSAVFLLSAAGYLMLAVAEPMRRVTGNVFYAPSPVNAGAFLFATVATILWTFGLVVMISERLAGEIADDARNMHSVFATSPDSSIISRLSDGRIDDVNDGFTRLTGYSREEVIGESAVTLGLWVDASRRADLVRALESTSTVTDFPFEMRRKDGTTVECLLAASTLLLDDERFLITVTRDVTQQRRMEAELVHQATTDSLTGLPNRRYFLQTCERELRRHDRSGSPLAVAVIDIDHFKDINDTYGHAVGDEAVVAFAAAVTSRIRDVDTLGRLGGDEFGLLLPDADRDAAHRAVERVRAELAASPLGLGDRELSVTLSAGVAVATDRGDGIDALLARADRSLYVAKERGRNRIEVDSAQ